MKLKIVNTLEEVLSHLSPAKYQRLAKQILYVKVEIIPSLLINDDFFTKAYLILPDMAIEALKKIEKGITTLKGREVYSLRHLIHLGYLVIDGNLYISKDLLNRLDAIDETIQAQRELSAYCLSMLEYVSLLYHTISIDALIALMSKKVSINAYDLRLLIKNVDPDQNYVRYEEDHYISQVPHITYRHDYLEEVNNKSFEQYVRLGFPANDAFKNFMDSYTKCSNRNDYEVRVVTHHVFRSIALGRSKEDIYTYLVKQCPSLEKDTYSLLDRHMRSSF